MTQWFVEQLKQKGILAILLMSLLGCGLSDYEKRIDEQRKRLEDYDGMNNQLDDLLEMPTVKSGKEDPKAIWPEFYLRLPKGFGTKEKDKDKIRYNWPFLAHYTCDDPTRHLYVAAVGLAETKDQEDYENFKYTPLNFRKTMKVAVEMLVRKQYWQPANWNNPSPKEFSISETPAERVGVKQLSPLSGAAPTITYTLITYSEKKNTASNATEFLAYYYEDKPKQICILVQRPAQLSPDHAFHKNVDASLGSLDLSGDAVKRRAEYLQLRRR